MVSQPRRNTLIVLVVALVALVMVSGAPLYAVTPGPGEEARQQFYVKLGDTGPEIWPYTASGPTFDRPVSPVNIVFDTDPGTVKRIFRDRTIDIWNISGDTQSEPVDHVETGLPWQELTSQDRFVYVVTGPDGQGEWRTPAYQLHSGDYFGEQYHLRVYNASAGGQQWTAIQAHSEHWDWFTLTHHVDSVEEPRQAIEEEFLTATVPVRVDRAYFRNGDSFDADGWTTIIQLTAGLFIPAGAYAGRYLRRTRNPTTRRLSLFGVMVGSVLAIRVLGIGSEVVGLDPRIVSKTLYLMMIFGTPAIAAVFGRRLPTPDAFALGAVGYGFGVIADYMVLTVGVLPIGLLIHRVVAAVAIGGIAASGATLDLREIRENGLLIVGGMLWALVVIIPLI